MAFIDTHAHLYLEQFDDDRHEMIERTFQAGVEKVYLPNIDTQSIEGMHALEATYPGNVIAMMGLHPCSVKPEDYKIQLKTIKGHLDRRHYCAIGEIGMDLYWDKTTQSFQEEAFLTQCEWAIEKDIPIIIHSRDAIDELIALIADFDNPTLTGIFHCFSGSESQADKILDLGFSLGIGGPVTYKKSTLPDVLSHYSPQHLVLETDAPYLPPVPHRGKRNESSYIPLVAQKLAQIYDMTPEEIGFITSQNAMSIFKDQTQES